MQVFDASRWNEEATEHVLWVPCCRKPEGGESWGSKEDIAGLDGLLRAHEDSVAGQRGRPNALELMRTFAPLLAEVWKMERWQARSVDLSMRNLETCLGMEIGEAVTRLPEDLRRIAGDVEVLTVEIFQLRALPAWLGELEILRGWPVLVGYEFQPENEFIREIPASIGELRALRELRLQGLMNVKDLPEGMKRLPGLEVLSVEYCGLREAPRWVREMGGLRKLKLDMLEVEELPEEMRRQRHGSES